MNDVSKRAFPSSVVAVEYGGMSLREWLAGQVIPAFLGKCDDPEDLSKVIRTTWAFADAMISMSGGPSTDLHKLHYSEAERLAEWLQPRLIGMLGKGDIEALADLVQTILRRAGEIVAEREAQL